MGWGWGGGSMQTWGGGLDATRLKMAKKHEILKTVENDQQKPLSIADSVLTMNTDFQ
jgi:hypothetical protein